MNVNRKTTHLSDEPKLFQASNSVDMKLRQLNMTKFDLKFIIYFLLTFKLETMIKIIKLT